MLLEIVPTVMVIVVLMTIVIVAVNPLKNYREARNEKRRTDLSLIADAVEQYTRDTGRVFLLSIPSAASREICADTKTGSCVSLFDLSPLIGTHLLSVPVDPLSEDPDTNNEHSRYFIQRTGGDQVTVTAPDTEPVGSADISVTR